jgi:hypothetical protein
MNETAIEIEGYLTEAKLATALQQMVGDLWVGVQVLLPRSRRRWDMAFKKGRSLVLVEFDGDEHYPDSLKVKVDREKDQLARENQMSVVHIPYWVQLDNITVQHYFGLSAAIRQTFRHGFITTKLFPASFCELGVERFTRELNTLPARVRTAVIESLQEQVKKYGLEYVLPSSLGELVR